MINELKQAVVVGISDVLFRNRIQHARRTNAGADDQVQAFGGLGRWIMTGGQRRWTRQIGRLQIDSREVNRFQISGKDSVSARANVLRGSPRPVMFVEPYDKMSPVRAPVPSGSRLRKFNELLRKIAPHRIQLGNHRSSAIQD